MSEQFLQDRLVLHLMRESDPEVTVCLHGPPDGDVCIAVPTPGPPAHPVAHIPAQHQLRLLSLPLAPIQDQPEAPIDDLSPANTASIVESNPGSSSRQFSLDVEPVDIIWQQNKEG